MGISTKVKATIKRIYRKMHLDSIFQKAWHKTSRYKLHVSNQELAWLREAAQKWQREEDARQRQEEKWQWRAAQAKQRHADYILRIAQGVKRIIDGMDMVFLYQYFYLDKKGEKCFNGGAERYARDLAALLAQQGESVVLVQIGDADSGEAWLRERDGMHIVGVPCTFHEYAEVVELLPPARLNIYSGYLRFGRLHHPNILISHGVTWDGIWENANVEELGERLCGIDTLVSVDTNTLSWLRSTFAKRLEENPCDLRYISNYADQSIFYCAENGTHHDGIHIVFPRRASVERGFWLMAEALPRIMQDFPSVTFDFVGYVHLPDIAERIQALASSYQGRIRCYAAQADEMPGIYQNADISVIPTRCTEGTSLSLIEAMACGSAVVCTNVGGLPDLVIDGFNGLMVNPNAEELYAAIAKLIKDEALRKRLAQNALEVASCFSKTAWDEKWTMLLRQALSAERPQPAKRGTRLLAITSSLYLGDTYHGYLNALYWAKQNGWLVLAPEGYVRQPLQYEDWMFECHDMQRVTEEERSQIPQFTFPDVLFEESEQDGRSWTERNLDLFRYRNALMEESLRSQLDAYFAEHPDLGLQTVFMFGESYLSLRVVAAHYGAKVYSYDFSTVREYKGFSQSLLMCSTNGKAFYGNDEPEERYKAFCSSAEAVPQFSRRELIALFYLLPCYPMIPLLDAAPRDEMGICLGCDLFLAMFSSCQYLDEDVVREVTAHYPMDRLPRRLHPASPMSSIERSRISLNPVPFLLSCRRIAAAASNTSFEAMLWNRTAYSRGMNMPFSFMCTQHPTDGAIVDEKFLNWFLFGYCVPGHARLFSEDYWRWRETQPSETEIYLRHQAYILEEMGITQDIMAMPEDERFAAIIDKRGYSRAAQRLLLENWENRALLRPVYDHLLSYVHILDAEGNVYAKYECINLQTDEGIVSRFAMEDDPRRERIEFCPLQEGIGFVRVLRVSGDGSGFWAPQPERKFRCMQQYATVPIAGDGIDKAMVLEILWEMRELSIENIPRLSYQE